MNNAYGKLEDLIELLDEDSNADVFYEQIMNEENDYTSPKLDHFSELYNAYSEVLADDTIASDDLNPAIDEFTQLCCHIIDYINDKFNTDLDVDSMMDTSHNLPGVTKALYQFFVTEFYENILSILKNYIKTENQSLYENFSDLGQKKDVMTGYFKKGLSEQMTVIASNIYDVTDFIFTKLDGESIMDYANADNTAALVIKKLASEGNISGDFVTTIADIYKSNVNLRSRICFEIVFALKNGDIEDQYRM